MVGQARMGIACGSMLSTPFLCGEKVCSNEKVSMSYHAMSNDDYTALLWHLNPTEVSYVTSDSHLWDFEERMKNASVSSCGVGQETIMYTLKHCLCTITTIMIWHAKIRGKFEGGGIDFILLGSAICVSTIWYLYTEEVHILCMCGRHREG